MKILHEKFRDASHSDAHAWRSSFEHAIEHNPELATFVPKAAEELNPLRVMQLLRCVPDEEVFLLNTDAAHARPELLLVSTMLVPPVCIRPSVLMDASVGSNEDDLTIKLSEIIHINNIIRNALEKGAPISTVMEDWDFLQIQVAMYVNSQVPGLPSTYDRKPIRSLCQRLKGKTGRFRGNLSGKRVDFSARTVISPDPNIGIHEVCIPVHVAQVLTYPERACAHNLSKLRSLVLNGPEVHPGANYVEGVDGSKRSLKYGDRRRAASELRVGDVVERHLHDGDVVLFNRQPSLHKLSIMAHRARVMPSRTFRFNECVCAPYNADFDGDEMNVHLPQTEEARAEASELMGSMKNIVTPRNGEPIIAATQDFITGAYVLTRKNVFLTRDKFAQLCAYCADAAEDVELPPPAILKPLELWTGKQVISVLLRPSTRSDVVVSTEGRNRSYTGKGTYQPEIMCPNDGWTVVHKSEYLAGVLDKSAVGSGSKDSLFAVMLRQLGAVAAGSAMGRLAKLTARFLANQGFSIGISDVTPSAALTARKGELVVEGNRACLELIKQFNEGKLPPSPGCNAEQTLEAKINGVLSQIRGDAGNICKRELHWLNAPLLMAVCGSKGSDINISQMVACVGQQTVSGKRAPDGFVQRALPHFPRLSREPAAKGFVSNSFFSGLTATEFFFHTMGGREGLVDTAVKTAETGYMQRRLMKAMEDLHIHYDNTVRNSEGTVVQLRFGDDGFDPAEMEAAAGRPVHFARTLAHLKDADVNAARATGSGSARSAHERSAAAAALAVGTMTGRIEAEPPISRVRMALVLKEELRDERLWCQDAEGMPLALPGAPKPAREGSQMRRELEVFVEELAERYDGVGTDTAAAGLDAETHALLRTRLGCVTEAQLRAFVRKVTGRLHLAKIEPGSAVGAIGAQSIGEPGTQMTLKTFHFAGVASMNVTLGVPRIKEIVNGARTISTPIITAELALDEDVRTARIVKGRVEKTAVKSICSAVAIVIDTHEAYVRLTLDLEAISALQLSLSAQSMCTALLSESKLKLTHSAIVKEGEAGLRVYPVKRTAPPSSCPDASMLWFDLTQLKAQLMNVIVCGIPSVERAIINEKEGGGAGGAGKSYKLLVEGTGLTQVMGISGVKGTSTCSNHIIETEKVLGIEAARSTIMSEIQYTMGQHGMDIDTRHVMLLADVMTSRGEVLGITRFGIAKMKTSVLMLASFEKTTDHLFDAAAYARRDAIAGVSECIIMGIPIPLGTGLFKLLQRCPKSDAKPPAGPKTLLANT